mmetsp:Transcript_12797/g.17143  ORF Transcript_12797/g.17143 Transcript_12797/m.17143 type:complete len:159 (+) Transcript_12797:5100-5576(+)
MEFFVIYCQILWLSETVPSVLCKKIQIKAREDLLKPVYLQAATEFADLHDKTGRMKAKGVISAAVPWEQSREYFYNLAKRRISQDAYVSQLKAADSTLSTAAALDILKSMCSADWEDNTAISSFYTDSAAEIAAKIASVKKESIQSKIDALNAQLGEL